MRILTALAFALTLLLAGGIAAQKAIPPAPLVNDEGGTVIIDGILSYTDPLFTDGAAQPVIILEDQAGFVDRNRYYLMPIESQVLGQLTTDFYESPVFYSLTLPQVPRGGQRDVDQDGAQDIGVQVFAVAYWENIFGDPYLEERDLFGGGWSGAYASTRISEDPAEEWEVVGGILVVYAPDDQQGFPSEFGGDGRLFTADDPIVGLPQGWTVVNLDTTPFTFDRSRQVTIDLIEPEGAALVDYSSMGLVEGFDAMIEKLRNEYVFTEYKNIDWDALVAAYRPRIERAERSGDIQQYLFALRDFNWSIPDGHVGWGADFYLSQHRDRDITGGLGIAVRELDDGRAVVTYLTAASPAEKAGIQLRAEIIALDGVPIGEAAAAVIPWNSPFSSDHVRRLEQFRHLLRSPIGTDVSVTYRNPGVTEPTTVTLRSIRELESFDASAIGVRQGFTGYELPLDYYVRPDGYVVAKIYSFQDNRLLSIQLWERLMQTLNLQGAPGLIIDMRENLGGSGFLADQMAAYLFDEPLLLGQTAHYDRFSGEFFSDPRGVDRYYLPTPEKRYRGPVAVLVGPNCNSACEFFSYDLTLNDRAAIVGQYPTAGLGGSIDYFILPPGIFFQFTAGRALDADGEIHIEGKGVVPTVRVPVNEETLFGGEDAILEAAVRHLNETS
ncbi:MAG: S41 family peptidase [Anaerolineae bacterium]|nr:S41 family peptidase [Anaerolineae bacterium]NUQ05707.1 PDZ domain-containing protein [Anaerolineae bacterium]